MPHAVVGPHQRLRAKKLRQTMTRAETLLWRHLKAERIDGLSFRRQVPLGRYVIDFVCHAARMAVELEGESHDFASRQLSDSRRDAWLASQGYFVMRFTNNEVLKNLSGVVECIRENAGKRMRSGPPSLTLPHKGGGNDDATLPHKGAGASHLTSSSPETGELASSNAIALHEGKGSGLKPPAPRLRPSATVRATSP